TTIYFFSPSTSHHLPNTSFHLPPPSSTILYHSPHSTNFIHLPPPSIRNHPISLHYLKYHQKPPHKPYALPPTPTALHLIPT
ncbi:hypothetical protein VIGAN_01165500, partial [Vigna angularis var. angularis]